MCLLVELVGTVGKSTLVTEATMSFPSPILTELSLLFLLEFGLVDVVFRETRVGADVINIQLRFRDKLVGTQT